MSISALAGDCTTTTALALCAVAPPEADAIIVEADRSGGSLAAWLDTPLTSTLSTIVASVSSANRTASWDDVRLHVSQSRSGIRFVAAPVRALEANRAMIEADTTVFPSLAHVEGSQFVADLGRHPPSRRPPPLADLADTIVVCHHQRTASVAAAGVRLERCAELVASLSGTRGRIVLAVIGDRPFDLTEIADFVTAESGTDVLPHALADDPLAAAVLAGRTGVSARRLARLPLMRSAVPLAELLFAGDPDDPHRVETGDHGGSSDVIPIEHEAAR